MKFLKRNFQNMTNVIEISLNLNVCKSVVSVPLINTHLFLKLTFKSFFLPKFHTQFSPLNLGKQPIPEHFNFEIKESLIYLVNLL